MKCENRDDFFWKKGDRNQKIRHSKRPLPLKITWPICLADCFIAVNFTLFIKENKISEKYSL